MVEEEGESLSDIVNEDEYQMLETLGVDSLGINTTAIVGSDALIMDPMVMNMMNADESALSMEDFKFMQQNNYIPSYHLFPPAEPQQLCNTDYSGPMNFEVFVDPNVLKNPWEYSPTLNKIYIDMKHKFPINFSVAVDCFDRKLFVRAMPMYEEDRHVQELVHRCICHEQQQDPTNQGIPEHVAQHIIRCDNSDAQYFGDKNAGKRLSVVIPLAAPQVGTDSVKEFFQFVCKNSCVGGMNRRPIQVVFTLEDQNGTVLGRRVLCVRICSCPKRDRDKEESKKAKQEEHAGKKRRMEKKVGLTEAADATLFTVNLTVPGEENYKHLIRCCNLLMASELLKREGRNEAPFRKCFDETNNLLNKTSE